MESKKSSSKLTTSPSREQQLPTLPIPPIRIRCQHIEVSLLIAPVNAGDGDVEVILVGMVIVKKSERGSLLAIAIDAAMVHFTIHPRGIPMMIISYRANFDGLRVLALNVGFA